MHFPDQAKIFIASGSGAGGLGAVGFRREKLIEYGGPRRDICRHDLRQPQQFGSSAA